MIPFPGYGWLGTSFVQWMRRQRFARTLAMQLLDIPAAIPEKVERLLRPVIKSAPPNSAERSPNEWDRFETQLLRWEQDPGTLEDDGLEPPNRETIPLIREVAHALRRPGRGTPVAPSPQLRSRCRLRMANGTLLMVGRSGAGRKSGTVRLSPAAWSLDIGSRETTPC